MRAKLNFQPSKVVIKQWRRSNFQERIWFLMSTANASNRNDKSFTSCRHMAQYNYQKSSSANLEISWKPHGHSFAAILAVTYCCLTEGSFDANASLFLISTLSSIPLNWQSNDQNEMFTSSSGKGNRSSERDGEVASEIEIAMHAIVATKSNLHRE